MSISPILGFTYSLCYHGRNNVRKLNSEPKILIFHSFLKLCKIKYYNFSPVHTVQPNFSFQTGDPIGPGSSSSNGGSSIWGLLSPLQPSLKTFTPEFHPKLKHTERGTVSMATAPDPKDPSSELRRAGSQFIITLGDNLEYLDGKAAIFGRVVEGFDVLEKINTAFIDPNDGRPLQDIRIRHTIILDEADIPDPHGLIEPSTSPVPSAAQLATVRIADDEILDVNADQSAVEKLRREREARAQALTLEMVGDLPFAEVAPPENVLFVCKLNPVTRDEDLDLIFSRFGTILSCEVIRDKRTGDSLQYAFIEFSERKECEQAYFKMQGVLIDDHRIHVDFSQSVCRLADVWRNKAGRKRGRGGRGSGGGFGGIEGLEKKRQYRAYGEDGRGRRDSDAKYGMMFDKDRSKGRRERSRDAGIPSDRRRDVSRSRSPRRVRRQSRDRYRDDRYRDDDGRQDRRRR